MKAQQREWTRLTPRRAEALVPALDALTASTLVLLGRPTGLWLLGAPLADLRNDAFALTWILFGLAGTILLLLLSRYAGHYDRRRPFAMEVADLGGWVLMLAALDVGLCLLGGLSPLPSLVIWTTVALGLPTQRRALRRRFERMALWRRPTVIVGVGYNAEIVGRALLSEPSLGLSVIAFADPNEEAGFRPGATVAPRMIEAGGEVRPVLPLSRLLPERAADMATHLVIAPDPEEMPACVQLFERLLGTQCDVDFFPPLGRLPLADARLARLMGGGMASIRLRERLSSPVARFYKRAFDLTLGLAIGLFALPLVVAIALVILVVDGRPVFFAQQRVGMNGRPFACFKFRTMVTDAESRLRALLESSPEARAEWHRDRKLRNDPRISRTGAWLRRTSLDELPQLLNVVRGEMSLIGPRPVVEDELRRYGPAAPSYLKIRPGLSGPWQVSGRNDVDYGRRIELDCRYVRNWSPLWDVVLLLATVRVVFTRRGAY